MNKEEIETLVNEFFNNLENQPNNFSAFWRNDLVRRVEILLSRREIVDDQSSEKEKLRTKTACQVAIEKTHDKKFCQIVEICENSLRKKFKTVLGAFDIECIMIDASDRWRLKYDARRSEAKNPELAFMKLIVKNALSNYVRRHQLQNVPLDEVDFGLKDPKNYFEDDSEKDAQAEREDLDRKLIVSHATDSLPIKLGGNFFPCFAFNEIFRYYSMTGKLEYTSDNRERKLKIVHVDGKPAYIEMIQPVLKPEYRHDRQAFSEIHQEIAGESGNFELANINILWTVIN